MLLDILKIENLSESVKEYTESIRRGEPLAVFGVEGAFKNLLVSVAQPPVLYVVKDYLTAESARAQIEQLSGKNVCVLNPKDEVLLPTIAFSKDTQYKRLNALQNIHKADVIIVSAEALIQTYPDYVDFIVLKVGVDYDFAKLIRGLVALGYVRTEAAESKGTFAVRGDIIDVFPIDNDDAVRIDFFGDNVESIKLIDAETRKTHSLVKEIKIVQAVESVFTESDYNYLKPLLQKEIEQAVGDRKLKLKLKFSDVELAIENNNYSALERYADVLGKTCSVAGLLKEDTVVVIDEGKLVYETASFAEKEITERYNGLSEAGEVFATAKNSLVSVERIKQELMRFQQVSLQALSTVNPFFNPLKIISPNTAGVAEYRFAQKEIFRDIRTWLNNGYRVIICAGNKKNADTFGCDLAIERIAYSQRADKYEQGVLVIENVLDKGFVCHDAKTVVIGSGNLFVTANKEKSLKVKRGAFFTAPEQGDYCVHETHGIGRVIGNRKISTTESTKDYVAVEYFGGDVLYVPVEQLDILTRYLGAEKAPKLSRLGGSDFARIKRGVIESIKKMSFDLKELYRQRSALKGYAFTEFDEMQALFEATFMHEDTIDQKKATEDVKRDMLSERVMDRLICGDVGFGKTEVSFRAVFRAILNGKQAAMLAPTTILSEQHFNTAKERFKDFAVRIECLNRFRTKAKQDKILQDLKDGKIDFIIGTHRLLSKDVEFKNLGLLVLDEEQRFGVEHKEKIKLLKKNVDALTLTATPIPRTLHMSLSGIREISTINTPPKKRIPVQVYVTEETETLIKDATMREINRGGQVFILYNRVETIFQYAEKLKKLLPNVKITVAHGQMDERMIENNVMDFYNGESQVLVTTTIIENGIDLPNANTIIVTDADMLGLSTLYQLKGRVGRSDRLAYAYFTYKRNKVLSGNAYERLNAIIQFTEMGSGIKIAMRDLEIRGAGNVLGAEQHGHMDKIGYELYSKLLKEELTGERERTVELDIVVSAYIPETYIARNTSRMEAYKRIAEIRTLDDAREIREDLTETFGDMPVQTQTLITIALVKRFASMLGVNEIIINKNFSAFVFEDLSAFSSPKLQYAMDYSDVITRVVLSGKPTLEIVRERESNEGMLYKMLEFLLVAEKYKTNTDKK